MKATRILCALLCAVLFLGVSSCGKKEAEQPYKDSLYLGEWKANSILSRDESVINYTTLSITLNADGTCSYNGESAAWSPDGDGKAIIIDLGKDKGTVKLNTAEEEGRLTLKYRIDTYYRASEFEQKDSDTAAPVQMTSSPDHTGSLDDPEPPMA